MSIEFTRKAYLEVWRDGRYVSRHTGLIEAGESASIDADEYGSGDYYITIGGPPEATTVVGPDGLPHLQPAGQVYYMARADVTIFSSDSAPAFARPQGAKINGQVSAVSASEATGNQADVNVTGAQINGEAQPALDIGPLNSAQRAQSYDATWQAAWVSKAQSILRNDIGQVDGFMLWIGDSLQRTPELGDWLISGDGKTADDVAICTWLHAGELPQDFDSLDGFYFQAPDKTTYTGYFLNYSRGFTSRGNASANDFINNNGMPDETTSQAAARAILLDLDTYPSDISLPTVLTALGSRPQFATVTVNLSFQNPGTLPNGFEALHDYLEAEGIVPIICTQTYRKVGNDDPAQGNTNEDWRLATNTYNQALYDFAQARGYPLVDLNQEMLNRRPITTPITSNATFTSEFGAYWDDGVHLSTTGGGYLATDDPYANGGDATQHITGDKARYISTALKGWLFAQKMKQIKELVVDALADPLSLPLVPDFASRFVYAGGFKLPSGTITGFGPQDFKFAGNRSAISISSDRTKMYANCQRASDSGGEKFAWAQINIPALDPAVSDTNMPRATVAQGPAEVYRALENTRTSPETDTKNPTRVKYVFEYSGMLVGGVQHHYEGDTDTLKNVFRIENASDLVNSNIGGYYDVTGCAKHPREVAPGWIGDIPTEWQPLFGGAKHYAGSAGHYNRVSAFGSDGPSLFLVDLDQFTVPSPTSVHYEELWSFNSDLGRSLWRNKYSHLLGVVGWDGAVNRPAGDRDLRANMYTRPQVTDPGEVNWPNQGDIVGQDLWIVHSRVGIGFIIPGTRTYACIGKMDGKLSGMGYKMINDQGFEGGGWQPYQELDRENHAWFFDLSDAVDCFNGVKDYSDIVPYWDDEIELPYESPPGGGSEGDGYIAGGTWDPDNKRLYVAINSWDSNRPLILAYDYTG